MSDNEVIKYNFAFLGDSGVGKTSIFRKIATNSFSHNTIMTIGTDKRTIYYTDIDVEIGGNKVKKSFEISLFDTAGQERYRALTKNYINGADGVILVYDITERKTFEHIELWLKSIIDILSDWNNSNYLIILIGNKYDLIGPKDEREVEIEEGKNLCDNKGIIWGGECSAKEFTDDQFKDLFKDFTLKVYSKIGMKDTNTIKNIKASDKIKKKCCHN